MNEIVRELKKEGGITPMQSPGRRFGAAVSPVLRIAALKAG
ncbi:MAG: hypothetical protein ACR2L2_20620 [Acidobacteriota bacterium]